MLNLNSVAAHQQIPLIHVVHEDDELLSNSPEAEWYKILQNLPWREYRPIGADYFNALYHFNKTRTNNQKGKDLSNESKESATQRLLFDRATMDETAPVLSEEELITDILPIVTPEMIARKCYPNEKNGYEDGKPVTKKVRNNIEAALALRDEDYWKISAIPKPETK